MMRVLFSIAMLLGWSGVAWSDEVYYCTDTKEVGIVWRDGPGDLALFKGSRYTMKILPDGTRQIKGIGPAWDFICEKPWGKKHKLIRCSYGPETWTFVGNEYNRAELYGKNLGGDSNAAVAYGTCTKF